MNKIVWNDAWTGPDKDKHILLCAVGVTFVGLGAGLTVALAAGTIAAVGKELVWDMLLKKGTPSPQDLVASGLGVALGWLTASILRAVGGA